MKEKRIDFNVIWDIFFDLRIKNIIIKKEKT